MLAPVGDDWFVDEVSTVSGDRWFSDRRWRESTPHLEIALRDDRVRFWGTVDPNHKILAEGGVVVTVANLGARPHRFEIAELGVGVEVEPGHSVSFVLNPPVGAYRMTSTVEDDGGAPVTVLDEPLMAMRDGEWRWSG